MAHPNEDLLRKGYEAFSKGDMETMSQLFAEDIVWRTSGRGPLAGTFEGQQAVFENFAKIPELSDEFDMQVHDIVGNDEHVVGLVQMTVTRDGKTYEDHAVHVYHVEDGRFTDAWIIQVDQAAADAFWEG